MEMLLHRVAFTVDLEDWVQSVYNRSHPVTDRFVRSTEYLCHLLDDAGVRATFFVLGLAAQHTPALIRRLHQAGHEIQSHGYDHTPVTELSLPQFRDDLSKSRRIIEDIIQQPVTAYRAPQFSIVRRTLWAIDALAEAGFTVDSSIIPGQIRNYGIRGWPAAPARVCTQSGRSILEIPVSTWSIAAKRIPMGGGYARLLPSSLIKVGLRAGIADADGCQFGVFYCHPYELDSDAFKQLSIPISLKMRLHQGTGRRRFDGKLKCLLKSFSFCPLSDIAGVSPPWSVSLQSDRYFQVTNNAGSRPHWPVVEPLPAVQSP